MRLASFLPMLLLAFSIPAAAQNCQIFDLTATVVQVNPINCQFFVSIDFQHNGTTNQYTVSGNGTNYGVFPYAALPLILGPFNSNPNAPTVLEFIVQDVLLPDCNDAVQIIVPPCGIGPCDITNLAVLPGICDPTGQTYSLLVNFDVQVMLGGTFDVWANGVLIGNFPIGGLPLLIPNFPASGNPKDVIKVCITNHPNCCEILEFPAPDCINQPCGLVDLSVQTGACLSDSTYKATIDFEVIAPAVADSFALWSNGQFIGMFGINQLPLAQVFEWDGGLTDEIKICLVNAGIVCCKTLNYPVPTCLPLIPCGIKNLVVKSDTCTSDSTFLAILNFGVNDPTAVDSFDLWANGAFWGRFGMDQLPLHIPDFPWNGLIFNHVRICTGNTVACCREYQFIAPDCLPFGPCEITDISLHTGPCTSDSTYKITLNFNGTNPGNGTFTVSIHNQLIDTFNLTELPLVFEVPWNGLITDFITICILEDTVSSPNGCCRIRQFPVPACLLPCSIFDVTLDPGGCIPGSNTYELFLDFEVINPGNGFFEVWGNGVYLGLFPLAGLPMVIPNFPANGNDVDVIKICINDQPDCCKTIDFQGPDCGVPCEIFDISVDPGACNPITNAYALHLNFAVNNPGNALFEVWGNGVYLGLFPLAGLPMVIPNFPSNGNAIDVIKICINGQPGCCQTLDFQGPNCDAPCEIFDLTVIVGDCHLADSTYTVKVNFLVQNPSSNTFGLWANGQFFGTFDLSQLPLVIPNFPWDNGPNDEIKVCLTNNIGALSCCRTIEYPSPDCFPNNNCDVNDLQVAVGNCTGDSTYTLTVNFQVANPPSNIFSLWANGQFFGLFNLSQLPLTIQDFQWDGGNFDAIKVCFTSVPSGQGACCAELEFHVPGCLLGGNCDIFDLTVTPGDCDPNTLTYPLKFDFEVVNPGNDFFEVWVNNVNYGTHLLSTLPFTIPNVPSNGNAADVIKVCINAHPDCCQTLDFPGPDCNGGGICEIFDVVIDPGICNPGTGTYPIHLNFQVVNPGNAFFEVWGNGIYLGLFPLAGLPMVIPNFPANGPAIDVIKICINDHPDCCRVVDFQGPNCGVIGNCEIFDLQLETGDCTGDSTYQLHIKFQVQNPLSDLFQVWANGQLFGVFNLNQVPLLIQNFPWNGGNFDHIQICLMPNIPGTVLCCIEKEFPVPDCLGNGDCKIYDLHVLRTPCLCGQFFALISFEHQNGGPGGFDILGNGNNYGNFPYNTPQPIILGPFDGDDITMYEFVVVDHDHPDQCGDDFMLGKVECMTLVIDPTGGSAMLTLSPNPTANWLNVTALLENGAALGQSNVEVYATDGRLVKTNTVSNGANFQLDVSNLPSGIYRLVLKSDSGRLEGTFAKE
ncbi:MAG: T9SS type A sorting domain-containing protein [Saprospiraceae bacterium]|nr:T9SS type A sorting domain-containing protein [Saprospiraceae bacterium]